MTVQPLSTALKCFHLLETIAQQHDAVRISELGRIVGESRATTYQRLFTLTTAGWLECLPDGRYRLSTRATRIGAAALKQAGFGERAQPVLDAMKRFGFCGETRRDLRGGLFNASPSARRGGNTYA